MNTYDAVLKRIVKSEFVLVATNQFGKEENIAHGSVKDLQVIKSVTNESTFPKIVKNPVFGMSIDEAKVFFSCTN